jgi:hypothetical protein
MSILNVNEPKELTFGVMPNRIFMAVPSKTLEFEEEFLQGKGTITWLIPTGQGYNPVKTKYDFIDTAPGVLEATLVNNGTDWATVDYTITHNHENGYIGVVSEYGTIQLGNVQEADMVQAEKSETITWNINGNFSNWTDGTVFYENQQKKAVTKMSYDQQYNGRLGILPAGFTNTANGEYFGAIKEFVWTTPAKEWYLWARAWFETGLMGQTGAWGLSIIDKNNRMIASMVIEKRDTVGNNAVVGFRHGNSSGANKGLKTIAFQPTLWLKHNPYGDEARRQRRNMFDIRKEGKRLTFFWYGKYFPFDCPEVENMEATRIQFFVGQFKGRTTTSTNTRLVQRMYVSDLNLRHNKVMYMKDVPNRFPKDSVVFIDGQNKKPYFNNMLRLSDEVIGSTYFKIPPGETKVQIVYSDFSDPAPEAFATVNEVYI